MESFEATALESILRYTQMDGNMSVGAILTVEMH